MTKKATDRGERETADTNKRKKSSPRESLTLRR